MSDDDGSDGSDGNVETAEPDLLERLRLALPHATRRLPGTGSTTPAEELRALADEAAAREVPDEWDRYGDHGPVAALERQVAGLLGKPAAVMFPSGIMAQQSVLRVWADRQHSKRIALPGLSHLLTHEQDGPQLLHGFRYERLTAGARVPLAADLRRLSGPLAAVLSELPLRDGGYLLPSWDELNALSSAARDRGVPLHLDGARLWESQPHFGHRLDELADLADSVYVSFYKGLGGLAGAVVAGPDDVIAETRQWRTRHGGTIFTLFPYAVAALRGLRTMLPRMAEFHDYALALADGLESRGITVFPRPPHSNAFRIFFPRLAAQINERLLDILEQDRLAIGSPATDADVPGWSWSEFTVGPATTDWPVGEAADLLAALVD